MAAQIVQRVVTLLTEGAPAGLDPTDQGESTDQESIPVSSYNAYNARTLTATSANPPEIRGQTRRHASQLDETRRKRAHDLHDPQASLPVAAVTWAHNIASIEYPLRHGIPQWRWSR